MTCKHCGAGIVQQHTAALVYWVHEGVDATGQPDQYVWCRLQTAEPRIAVVR